MSEASALEEGEIHDILRNDRRREVIAFLSDHDGEATIRELSEHIGTVESGEEPPPRNVRQSVYVSLHQTHLPKLEALGVIDYDTDSKAIRVRDRMREVEAYMEPATDGDELTAVYAGLGALGVLLSLVAIADVIGPDGGFVALPVFLAIVLVAGYRRWKRAQT